MFMQPPVPQTFCFELCALCRVLVGCLAMAAAELRKALPQLLDAVRQAVETMEQGPAHVMQPIAGCHPLFSVEDFVSRMKLPEKWQEGEAYPEYKGAAHSIFALARGMRSLELR